MTETYYRYLQFLLPSHFTSSHCPCFCTSWSLAQDGAQGQLAGGVQQEPLVKICHNCGGKLVSTTLSRCGSVQPPSSPGPSFPTLLPLTNPSFPLTFSLISLLHSPSSPTPNSFPAPRRWWPVLLAALERVSAWKAPDMVEYSLEVSVVDLCQDAKSVQSTHWLWISPQQFKSLYQASSSLLDSQQQAVNTQTTKPPPTSPPCIPPVSFNIFNSSFIPLSHTTSLCARSLIPKFSIFSRSVINTLTTLADVGPPHKLISKYDWNPFPTPTPSTRDTFRFTTLDSWSSNFLTLLTLVKVALSLSGEIQNVVWEVMLPWVTLTSTTSGASSLKWWYHNNEGWKLCEEVFNTFHTGSEIKSVTDHRANSWNLTSIHPKFPLRHWNKKQPGIYVSYFHSPAHTILYFTSLPYRIVCRLVKWAATKK